MGVVRLLARPPTRRKDLFLVAVGLVLPPTVSAAVEGDAPVLVLEDDVVVGSLLLSVDDAEAVGADSTWLVDFLGGPPPISVDPVDEVAPEAPLEPLFPPVVLLFLFLALAVPLEATRCGTEPDLETDELLRGGEEVERW